MLTNNFTAENIIDRVMLFLPSRFTRSEESTLYKFIYGIASALKLNSDAVDELFRQTNLTTSSGEYTDMYIEDLADLGRKNGESDANYKDRYYKNVFIYNSTADGIRQIVIDIEGESPEGMYSAGKRGAFLDSRYYFNDTNLRSTYGDKDAAPFTGYIHLKQKPRASTLDELCKTINRNKAVGTNIYFFYPELSYGYGNTGYGNGGYGES